MLTLPATDAGNPFPGYCCPAYLMEDVGHQMHLERYGKPRAVI
ncbi:hypothetical protein ACFLV4_01895 [Chloroflexota bacterium]